MGQALVNKVEEVCHGRIRGMKCGVPESTVFGTSLIKPQISCQSQRSLIVLHRRCWGSNSRLRSRRLSYPVSLSGL